MEAKLVGAHSKPRSATIETIKEKNKTHISLYFRTEQVGMFYLNLVNQAQQQYIYKTAFNLIFVNFDNHIIFIIF